jgi:NAD(P)-dependent dehydrogenase (short-subunit alcohol dehydrogenase family)
VISLLGKRALVTGGSRGIGAATATLLAECGADVGIGYRARAEQAGVVAKQIADRGVRAFAQASDISTREGAEALVDRAVREFGGIDIFVANAGIWPVPDVPLADMVDERWFTTMRENVDSMFYSVRAASSSSRVPPASAASRITPTTRRARAR